MTELIKIVIMTGTVLALINIDKIYDFVKMQKVRITNTDDIRKRDKDFN